MNNIGKPRIFLDVRWISCPYNQTKVILSLQDMKAGHILEVLVEEGEPLRCVTEGVENKGCKIIFSEKIKDSDSYRFDRIWIQKQ